MAIVAVVYHSGYGHTERVAELVAEGAGIPGVTVHCLSVDSVDWDILASADAIVFGAPTYMGSVSAAFKQFMDDSSVVWFQQGWQDKLAAGFTNSGALNGDKQVALQQLQTFAAQQGMLWLSFPLQPSGQGVNDLNRLGAHTGLMTQSDNDSPEVTPPAGDRRTAVLFGRHVAERALRWSRSV